MAKPKAKSKEQDFGEDFSYIIRIADTDIDGQKPVVTALTSVKGIGMRTSAVICGLLNLEHTMLAGNMSAEQQEQLKSVINDYASIMDEKSSIWMLNRQRDLESGDEVHQFGIDVKMSLGDDIERLRSMKTYRGVRHASRQKVRGQRGRSNGRRGLTLGVQKKK